MLMSEPVDPTNWVCPMPLRETKRIVMGHGGGGILSEELIENLFLPAFGSAGGPARDSAVLETGVGRIALTTDSYVVNPLFFPGGNIGDLTVNGTINDLACSGAQPIGLTAGFILEEGLELEVLGAVAASMGRAAEAAGVGIVTGDTKVVGRGGADSIFINTASLDALGNFFFFFKNVSKAKTFFKTLLPGKLKHSSISGPSSRLPCQVTLSI